MIDETKRRGLGRGLSALFGDEAETNPASNNRQQLPLDQLQPGRWQPRRHFDEGSVANLAESIRARGILSPLLVRMIATDRYEIIAGERRWRAAQMAGLHEVPAIIRSVDDREALEIALVENVQREDLSPLEEAEGFRRLVEEFGHTQEALAQVIGKSRSHIANMLRLLALPEAVKIMVGNGQLTAGHARALLAAPDPAAAARDVIGRGLNVRQTENLVRQAAGKHQSDGVASGRSAEVSAASASFQLVAAELSDNLGLFVQINPGHAGKEGALTIRYRTIDQLNLLISRLKSG